VKKEREKEKEEGKRVGEKEKIKNSIPF